MNKNRDLTQGNTLKMLFVFMLPMLIGQVFQQIYNIADKTVVGVLVGPNALAAVGTTGSIFFLFVAVANGMSAGGGVVIGQHFGAGDTAKTHKAINTFLIFQGVVAQTIGILGLFIVKPLLRAMNTPPEIMNDAFWYLAIFLIGLAPNFLYFALAAVYRALGDSTTPLILLIICSILNVGLDILFVAVFHWDVPGVAAATILSQTICTILSYLLLRKRLAALHQPQERGWRRYFDPAVCWQIAKLAIPSTIQMSAMSISSMLMQRLINGYGSLYIAAYSTAVTVENIATMPSMSMGMAITAFTAQNIGAGKLSRVREGFKSANIIMIGIGLLGIAIVYPFGPQILSMLVSGEGAATVIDIGSTMVRFCILFAVFNGFKFVVENTLKGAGDVRAVMFISIFTTVVRLVSAYATEPIFGFPATYYSYGLTIAVSLVLAWMRYFSGKWKRSVVLKDVEFDEPIA